MFKLNRAVVLTSFLISLFPTINVYASDQPITISTNSINPGLTFMTPLPQEVLLNGLFFQSPEVKLSQTSISMDPPQLITPLEQLKVTQTLTPTSTSKPTFTPTPTQKPSPTPTLSTPISSLAPTTIKLTSTPTPQPPTQVVPVGNSRADQLFTLTQNYRAAKGLPPFIKDERVCAVAESRAPELAAEFASGNLHQGIRARNLPYWNSENVVAYNTVEESFNWLINDYIHRVQIEGDYKYSCVACSGINCVQEFTNLQMK